MVYEFKLPDLGEGVHEGEIVRWLVKAGDEVERDQPLVEVMTDKVTTELPSPVAGRVERLGGEAGEVVPVGTVLIEIETHVAANGAVPAATTVASGAAVPESPSAGSEAASEEASPVLAVPAVRRLARELGVPIGTVSGSGPGGRVVAQDVRRAAGGGTNGTAGAGQPVKTVRRVPLRGKRRAIAEHLLASHRNTAPCTLVEEADFSELVRLRERVRPMAEQAGVAITYLPFILAALSMALREHPTLNATVDPESGDLLVHAEQHFGIAVHTDDGLVVPVLRNVESKNLLELAREIDRLSRAAREDRLNREDVSGGTFSVTSLGLLGGVLGTPMLHTPQVAVLGIHRIAARAVVREGSVVPRQMANLSLTLDHRYLDGYVAAKFIQTLVGYLEDPAVMLFWLSELRSQ
jgi:pyruvate dehydrogenase E2 component (dihydrolipoamide acetyltransferase)